MPITAEPQQQHESLNSRDSIHSRDGNSSRNANHSWASRPMRPAWAFWHSPSHFGTGMGLFIPVPDRPVPEFIDPVSANISPKRSFSMTENERFALVFAKTGSKNSGTDTRQSGIPVFRIRMFLGLPDSLVRTLMRIQLRILPFSHEC